MSPTASAYTFAADPPRRQNRTSPPASARVRPNAVPHAPPPITPTLSNFMWCVPIRFCLGTLT